MRTTRTRLLALALAPGLLVGTSAAALAQSTAPPAWSASVEGSQVAGGARIAGDVGAVPFVFDMDRQTRRNQNFRTAAWTADDLQLTLMSIPANGDVGLEMHSDIDQFLRIESGRGQVRMGNDEHLGYVKDVGPGDVIMVPSGTWHNLVNTGGAPLKVYSLYGPAAHPQGTVHRTRADDPRSSEPKPTPTVGKATPVEPFSADPGAEPFVFNIEQATSANTNFRTAAWTADSLQLTLMDIPVGGEAGLEMHSDVDQFVRLESGRARVYLGDSEGNVRLAGVARPGAAILIPSGTWHNIVNDDPERPLELYALNGPAQHPQGTIHVTKDDAAR